MNKIVVTLLAYILLPIATELHAQDAVVRRGATRTRSEDTNRGKLYLGLSQRAIDQSLDLTQELTSASWMRTIYRRLDLRHEANAVLYYPVKASSQEQNLFTQIFRLLNGGQLRAYEYLDGQELFEPEYQVKFSDLLDRFNIMHTIGSGNNDSRYIVALSDIPSAEVQAYYVKETWFFDHARSRYDVRIDAICPILMQMGDYGEVSMPIFWVPYQELRPHIASKPVMLSSINNVEHATLDDYFRLGLYKGDIVKTYNLRGEALAQMVPNADSLSLVQKRIEQELINFRNGLYVPDSLLIERAESSTLSTKAKANSRDKRVRSSRQPKATRTSSASKSSSSSRSVRGRG